MDVWTTLLHLKYAPIQLEMNPLIKTKAHLYVLKTFFVVLYASFFTYYYRRGLRLEFPRQTIQLVVVYGFLILLTIIQFYAATHNYAGLIETGFYGAVASGQASFSVDGDVVTYSNHVTGEREVVDTTNKQQEYFAVVNPFLYAGLLFWLTTWVVNKHYYKKEEVLR